MPLRQGGGGDREWRRGVGTFPVALGASADVATTRSPQSAPDIAAPIETDGMVFPDPTVPAAMLAETTPSAAPVADSGAGSAGKT